MKIITYSDLHLEFSHDWLPAEDVDGDVMILAGDIISFRDYSPLTQGITVNIMSLGGIAIAIKTSRF